MTKWFTFCLAALWLSSCDADEEFIVDSTRIPVPALGIHSGVYTQGQSSTWQARLNAISSFEQFTYQDNQTSLSMDRQFYRWDNLIRNNQLNPYIKATSDAGRIPIISIATLNQQPDNSGSREVQCPDGSGSKVWVCIVDGHFDNKIRDMASKLRDSGVPQLGFSFMLEPENEIRCHNRKNSDPEYQCVPVGNSFDMGSASDYQAASRHVIDIFKEENANNVDFIWILQGSSFDDATRHADFPTPTDIYPGDEYIDWVAANVYNTAFNGNWKSLQELASGFVSWGKTHTPGKPLMFAELGAAEDPSATEREKRAQWISNAAIWLKTQSRIKALLYFNRTQSFSSADTFRDWRIDSLEGTEDKPRYLFRQQALPYSQDAFRLFMQDCYFRQTGC